MSFISYLMWSTADNPYRIPEYRIAEYRIAEYRIAEYRIAVCDHTSYVINTNQ